MSTNSLDSSRITLPDPGYSTCEDTYVKLLIYPGLHGANEVTDVLRIEPTSTQDKGEEIFNSRGSKRVAKNSLWVLSSGQRVASKDLRDHLNWLLNKIQSRSNRIKKNTGMG